MVTMTVETRGNFQNFIGARQSVQELGPGMNTGKLLLLCVTPPTQTTPTRMYLAMRDEDDVGQTETNVPWLRYA